MVLFRERLQLIGITISASVVGLWGLASARQLRRRAVARQRLQELLAAAAGDNARIVITGASSGIGKELAQQFARHPSVLLLLGCRDGETHETGCTKVMPLELLEFDSVQQFADEACAFLAGGDRGLRLLINNAGVQDRGGRTKFGVSPTWQTNFLGPFLLTELIARHREVAHICEPLRVVNVASGRESEALLSEESLDVTGPGEASPREYADSKRAILLWISVRAQSFALKSNMFTQAVMPGRVDTRLGMYSFPSWLWPLTKPLRFLLYRSPAEGALSVAAAGLRPQAAQKFGQYFGEEELLEDLVVWRMPQKKLAVLIVRWANQVTALEARSGGRPLSTTGRPLSRTDLEAFSPIKEDRWSSAERRWRHST